MINIENELEWMHNRDIEFAEIIHKYFPSLQIDGYGNAGPNFHATFSDHNKFFIGSEYSYAGKFEFVHFTKLEFLFSILNYRSIRLYNLHSSADSTEYEYGAKLLEMEDYDINYRKSYLFTFSFCSQTEIENNKMWEIYGSEYKGVGIVFEIINDPTDWINFHIAEVKYKPPEEFENYKRELKEFKTKNGIDAFCDLSKIISFYKIPKLNEEKEIRLVTYNPYTDYEEKLKYVKNEFRFDEHRNRVTSYIELPLWVDNESYFLQSNNKDLDRKQYLPDDYFNSHPKIKIKKIVFGKNTNLTWDDFSNFQQELKGIVLNNLGYEIEIEKQDSEN
jgi:hypothetical protein